MMWPNPVILTGMHSPETAQQPLPRRWQQSSVCFGSLRWYREWMAYVVWDRLSIPSQNGNTFAPQMERALQIVTNGQVPVLFVSAQLWKVAISRGTVRV